MEINELTDLSVGAGEGNRTLVFSLEGCCSTIELHPRGLNRVEADGDELTRPPSGLNTPEQAHVSRDLALRNRLLASRDDP